MECKAKAEDESVKLCKFYQDRLKEKTDSLISTKWLYPLGMIRGVFSWIEKGDLVEIVEMLCKGIVPPQAYV